MKKYKSSPEYFDNLRQLKAQEEISKALSDISLGMYVTAPNHIKQALNFWMSDRALEWYMERNNLDAAFIEQIEVAGIKFLPRNNPEIMTDIISELDKIEEARKQGIAKIGKMVGSFLAQE